MGRKLVVEAEAYAFEFGNIVRFWLQRDPALTRTSSNRILQKTTDYLEHFARFRRKENVEAVERLLTAQKELAKFERAQLGMFCPTHTISFARVMF
jgi:hypothetical protein